MADNILSDFGISILEEEIDDVIFQTNEFLCDATFTGTQGPFWWLRQFAFLSQLKPLINQCLTPSCSSRKSSHGTKTGQNHRKSYTRTLLTEDAFAVHSLRLCKGTNLSLKKRTSHLISLIYKPFWLRSFLKRITQVAIFLQTILFSGFTQNTLLKIVSPLLVTHTPY